MFLRMGCWNDLAIKPMETLNFNTARIAGINRHAALNTPVGEIDISWMEAAAAFHDVSPDPHDYVFSVERAVVADIPNRNSDVFTRAEIHRFNGNLSLPAWKTFERRPVYYEHNQVPKDARGLIFKSFVEVEGPYQVVTCVTGVCRKKDRNLAEAVRNKTRPYWSMGCLADSVECSICGKTATEQNQFCKHLSGMMGQVLNGRLVYEILKNVTYIELSNVGDPAALIAGNGSFDIQNGKAVDLSKSLGW